MLPMNGWSSLLPRMKTVAGVSFAVAAGALLAACGEQQPQKAACAAAARRHHRVARAARGVGFRRICRPLRRRQRGRGARARVGLSGGSALQGRPDGQAGRPAVHHRQAAVPERGRPGPRQSGAGAVQSRLHRIRLHARPAAGARQDHHRSELRAALAGLPQRPGGGRGGRQRRCAPPNSTSNSPNCARRSTAASATAASRRATWSPAAPAATPRCSPPSSRPIRSISNSPSMRRRICATSAWPRTAWRTSPAAAPACRWRSS